MRREQQTVWTEDGSADVLLRLYSSGNYSVLPGYCESDKLAELGKAIFDALVGTTYGDDMAEFVRDKQSERVPSIDCDPLHEQIA